MYNTVLLARSQHDMRTTVAIGHGQVSKRLRNIEADHHPVVREKETCSSVEATCVARFVWVKIIAFEIKSTSQEKKKNTLRPANFHCQTRKISAQYNVDT